MRKPGCVRSSVMAVAAAAALGLCGCGNFFVPPGSTTSPGTTPSTTSYAYVTNSTNGAANATSTTLSAFALASGTLTQVSGSPYTLGLTPTCVTVTPANTFVYVAGLGAIFGYSIGTGGQLTPLSGGAALASASAASMDVSPDGHWLFVLDVSGITLDEYAINPSTGALTVATGANFAVSGGAAVPKMVKVTPNGAYVIAAMGNGGDVVFTFNTTTGVLIAVQSLAGSATTSDNGLAIDASSSHLYVARSGAGAGVAAFMIGSGGALASVAGSPFSAGGGPYAVTLDSTGAYLYVTNRTDGTISGYAVATTGVLTALISSPFPTGFVPSAIGHDGTGKYLLSVGFGGSPDLTMYSFDSASGGKLNSVSTSATGTDPTGANGIALTH